MEAIAAIDRKLNDYNSTGNAIRARLRQLRDSVSSAAAGTAAASLEAARLDLAAVDADVLSRRDSMLTSLAKHGVFFRIDRGWFMDSSRRTLIDAPRDSMIVDAVIQDAAGRQQEAVFYTENSADFDTPSVRSNLLMSHVKLTSDINIAAAYIEGLRPWGSIPS